MRELCSLNSKLFDLTDINPLIVKYKVAIANYKTKANGFYFSKEVLSMLFNTIKGSPVLTYYDKSIDGFAGHEGDLYKNKAGLKRTPELSAIGFTSYDDNGVFWETLNLDGEDKEWLCACVYLWKDRYPFVSDLIDKTANQSMELELNFEVQDGVKVVTEAQFNGIALIGVQPAFKGSQFLSFSKSDYSKQVSSLQHELDSLNKYAELDFSIPFNVKNFSENILKSNDKLTSVCKSNIEYLFKNDYISPDKVSYMQNYFSKIQNRTTFSLSGEDVILNWCETLINQMKEVDKAKDLSINNFSNSEFAKDEIGSGDYSIKIDKSKDSISNDDWGNVNKTSLMHKVLKAKNVKMLVKDIYMVVENGWENAPSEKLRYPVMQIKNDIAVYNSNALSSALAYANHPDTGNKEVAKRVIGIQKKLGLLKDNKKEGEEMAKFTKTQKVEFSTKFSLTVNQMLTMMNDMCSTQKYETENGNSYSKYWISDFDDMYMYGWDQEKCCNMAIPFEVSEDGKVIPDFENAKMVKQMMVWIVSEAEGYEEAEEDDTYTTSLESKYAKVEEMCNTKLSEIETKLTDTETKLGVQFAATTSLETALADEKAISEARMTEIEELSKQLKAKEEEQKFSKAKELLNKKEFSVFSAEKKAEIIESSKTIEFSEFETHAYAELGKFASTNLEFDMQNGKFSSIYVPSNPKPDNKNSDNDVYAETRKKLGINQE